MKASANIQNINLFGVPLEQDFNLGSDDRSTDKEKNEKRRLVKELVDLLVSLDPDNALLDLEEPKTFIQFDPYSDGMAALNPFEQQAMALKYEDNVKLRASLVMDAFTN